MKRALLIFAAVLTALGAGCDTRNRENPFDPLNPDTGGRPPLLTASARNGIVDLRWEDGGMVGIELFTIYEGRSADSLELVVSIPRSYRLFREVGLTNGVTYYFAIGFKFYDGDVFLTAAEPATPGPDVPWALDISPAPLAILGADGRSVISREGAGLDLIDLSAEQDMSIVWCVDGAGNALLAYDKNGHLVSDFPGFDFPTRVSADLVSGGVWVISFDAGTLERVDQDGRRSVVDTTLVMPLDVDASPLGGCWVCDAQGLVHRYAPDGEKVTVEQVARPWRLSSTQKNEVWVADPLWDEAQRISVSGVVAKVEGLDGPYDVAATTDGGCWIADRTRVLRVDEDGEILLTAGGFTGARALDYNPRTGECWVADSQADRIVRLSADGERITVLTDFSSPFEVAGRWEPSD